MLAAQLVEISGSPKATTKPDGELDEDVMVDVCHQAWLG